MSDSVFDLSVADVLNEMGIAYKKKGMWHNFVTCPLCDHNDKGEKCGVSTRRGVKCFHGGGASGLGENPKYGAFLKHIGALDRSWGSTAPSRAPLPVHGNSDSAPRPKVTEPASLEWVSKLERSLWKTPSALAYLRARGLTDETIRRFHIGLRVKVKDGPAENCLSFPRLDEHGALMTPYACYAVPGLTTGSDSTAWAPSPLATYYADPVGKRRHVMVCEGMKDVWRLWQELQGSPLGDSMVICTSTHGTSPPPEWKSADYWAQFETIYLAFDRDDAGDKLAKKVASWVLAAGRTAMRLVPPEGLLVGTNERKPGKDWTDFFLAGCTVTDLAARMKVAEPVEKEVIREAAPGVMPEEMGRHEHRPVDLTSTLVDGKLYVAVNTLVRSQGKSQYDETKMVTQERIETVLVCSDRQVHSARQMPCPPGTPVEHRVWRLNPANLLIDGPPRANSHGTWSWNDIQRWRNRQYTPRPLHELVTQIKKHFRSAFWLPHDEDYILLALTVVVTYLMPVFEAVPLILVNGPRGTGKTTIGNAMAGVSYNGTIIGTASAATVARMIDESRGFVSLDDLESVGTAQGGGDKFNELCDILKLSYNRDTATKDWTDAAKGMKIRTLNFFGVKCITNTTGVDSILGSRMFRIYTRLIPPALRGETGLTRVKDVVALKALRADLHAWAFDHVQEVEAAYLRICPGKWDRAEEIAGPLRVMADLAGDEDISAKLKAALERQARVAIEPDDPVEVLREAAATLVRAGYRELSLVHVSLEMAEIFGHNWGKEFKTDFPKWQQPEWVGRHLRTLEITDSSMECTRPRLDWGHQLRMYPVSQKFVEEVTPPEQHHIKGRDAKDFCVGCATCRYATAGCDLQADRMRWEAQHPRTPGTAAPLGKTQISMGITTRRLLEH